MLSESITLAKIRYEASSTIASCSTLRLYLDERISFFPEENIFSLRWLFLITIKFYHRLAGTLVPRDAFLGRAKASLRSELLAFRVLL